VRSAIKSGCTHILVLLTRPSEYFVHEIQGLSKHFVSWLLGPQNDEFLHSFYKLRIALYNEARDLACGRVQCESDVKIAYIAPDERCPRITRYTIAPGRLRAAAVEMMRRTRAIFAPEYL
jgi:hypothetical protein